MAGTYIVVALVAYLLGSIPFGYILLRLFRGQDVRATGSGNIGATNVARSAPGLGLLTLLLDAAKGYAAVAIAFEVFPRIYIFHTGDNYLDLRGTALALAALSAILGHMFPVWLRFRGGKGVATAAGAFLVLSPLSILVALAVFAVAAAVSRYVSLGSMLGAAIFPLMVHLLYPGMYPPLAFAFMVAASLLIILKHHQNIRRLLAGTENRFTLKGKSA